MTVFLAMLLVLTGVPVLPLTVSSFASDEEEVSGMAEISLTVDASHQQRSIERRHKHDERRRALPIAHRHHTLPTRPVIAPIAFLDTHNSPLHC